MIIIIHKCCLKIHISAKWNWNTVHIFWCVWFIIVLKLKHKYFIWQCICSPGYSSLSPRGSVSSQGYLDGIRPLDPAFRPAELSTTHSIRSIDPPIRSLPDRGIPPIQQYGGSPQGSVASSHTPSLYAGSPRDSISPPDIKLDRRKPAGLPPPPPYRPPPLDSPPKRHVEPINRQRSSSSSTRDIVTPSYEHPSRLEVRPSYYLSTTIIKERIEQE